MSFGTKTPRFYEVGEDRYPSVTTILSVLDKPALLPWVAKCVVEYIILYFNSDMTLSEAYALFEGAKKSYRDVSKKACDIGTAVHGAVEYYLKGAEPQKALEMALKNVAVNEGADLTDEFIDKAGAGFDAFLSWAEDHNLEPVALEVRMDNHEFRYAGRVDFVGRVDGILTLIDFKTSKGFYDEYAMQTAAYRDCIPEGNEFDPRDVLSHGVLRLDKDTGKPHYKDYSGLYEHDLAMFQALAQFYHLSLQRRKELA